MSSEYNRKRSNKSESKSGDVIDNEVKKLFRANPHHISNSAMYKLREKYGDKELLDQIQDAYIEKSRSIRKRARKFAKLIIERYGTQNYPLHILLKKALKFKKKYNLSDSEFSEFRRIYEQAITGNEVPQHVNVTVPFTNMGRTLGQGMVDENDGMKFNDKDYDSLQKVLRLYNETKAQHAQVVLQSMVYEDCAHQALTGKFNPQKNNPHCHIHPVVAALFLPKIAVLENHMLRSNLSYIVKQRYTKQPILTATDYDVFYDLISDPSDVVCSSESAVKDLLMRCQLQHHLWNQVVSLRNGRYYDCNNTQFMIAVDNCRRTVNDNPDLIYEGDEGTVIQRLLGAFSLRPTIMATSPLYNVLTSNPLRTQAATPRVQSMPMVTLRLPHDTPLNTSLNQHQSKLSLESALNQSQWYVEDGNVVPRNQQVIYSKGILVFYVPRRAHTLNIGKLIAPQQFHRLPRTQAGFDRLNERAVDFELDIDLNNGTHKYNLRSIVCVEINTVDNNSKHKLIIGSSAIVRSIKEGNSDTYKFSPSDAAVGIQKSDGEWTRHSPIVSVDHSIVDNTNDWEATAQVTGSVFIYSQDGSSKLDPLISY